jgi:hypothetical protein
LGSAYLYGGKEYEFYTTSSAGNVTASSSHYMFNVTAAPATTTTTTTLPPPLTCDAGSINSVVADTYLPTIGQTVKVDVYVTNNGTKACNYTVGLSIGNATFACNKDCYADGIGDYISTGTVAPLHTVMVSRYFTFRPEFFIYNRSYTAYVGIYSVPYLPPSSAMDYKTYVDLFTTKSIASTLDAYAISVTVQPSTVSLGGEVRVTAYVYSNSTVPYTYKLGLSIGIWNATNGQKYPVAQAPLIPPCNHECYTDGLGDWVTLIIPQGYTAPFTRRLTVPDYFLQNNDFDVAVGVYAGDTLVNYVYFKNVAHVPLATTGQVTNVLEPTGAVIAATLGTTTSWGIFLLLISIAIGVGSYVAYKTKHGELGVTVVALLIVAFYAMGANQTPQWIPLWFVVLIIIIAAALAARMFGHIFGGGGN